MNICKYDPPSSCSFYPNVTRQLHLTGQLAAEEGGSNGLRSHCCLPKCFDALLVDFSWYILRKDLALSSRPSHSSWWELQCNISNVCKCFFVSMDAIWMNRLMAERMNL